MLNIGVLVSGGGTNLQSIIDGISSGLIPNSKIVTVVSSKPGVYALTRAKNHGLDYRVISKEQFGDDAENELCKHLIEKECGLIVLAGYMKVLSAGFVSKFENRIMNIHPSLVPSFCGNGYFGLRVHEKVLARGVKVTGATVHFVDNGTDTGPIIRQKAVEVLEEDTPLSVQKRVMVEAEQVIYPLCVSDFAQGRLFVDGKIVRRKD